MQLQQKPKEKKLAPEERVEYPPSLIHQTITGDSESGELPRPIFRIERVARV